MSLKVPGAEWRAKTLRAWQLAILRFAVTLDNADRLAVIAIAGEIDRLGPTHDSKADFSFFRRTSAELCAAILTPNELTPTVLRQYLARIDDDRLKHVFAATIEADQPKLSSISKPFKRDNGLWKGLSSRGNL
ncbi:MAG: hypothetical protein QOJ15_11072 [Bradyrhizobium sp.]|jgi:hypothetical protein|nr:hypothetical protein [Bradyrhizobium sp.]